MDKKEEFKEFASKNKYLFNLVSSGKTTWQKLYETYDIYGPDTEVWSKLRGNSKESNINVSDTVKSFISNLKNIDTDKLEENVSSLQKALGFLEEIVTIRNTKSEEKKKSAPKKKDSTVVERFFDD